MYVPNSLESFFCVRAAPPPPSQKMCNVSQDLANAHPTFSPPRWVSFFGRDILADELTDFILIYLFIFFLVKRVESATEISFPFLRVVFFSFFLRLT